MVSISLDPKRVRARYLADKFDVVANMVRSRMESGVDLRAQEIIDGVKLTHEEFLYLYEHARQSMYHETT